MRQTSGLQKPSAEKLEVWRKDYNEQRPHGAIGNKVPIELLKSESHPARVPDLVQKTLLGDRGQVGAHHTRKKLLPNPQSEAVAHLGNAGIQRCLKR